MQLISSAAEKGVNKLSVQLNEFVAPDPISEESARQPTHECDT